jgi:hypothetical protein
MLGEIRSIEKDKYCMISPTYGIWKVKVKELNSGFHGLRYGKNDESQSEWKARMQEWQNMWKNIV